MKLIKRVSPPTDSIAIDQGGVWLVTDDCAGTVATKAQVDAVTIPHPAGGGRRMLRQVPAGVVLIEVVAGKPVATEVAAEPKEEPIEIEVIR